MIDELDKEPQVIKEFGNNLRDISYGIGSVGNFQVCLELVEWDCPISDMANVAEVISGDKDDA